MIKDRKHYEKIINDQRTPNEPLEVGEEVMTRALVAINNLLVVNTELLLDIRDSLKDIDINTI